MRQVLHTLSAAVFLLLGSAGKPLRQDPNLPSLRAFQDRIWAGEIDLADNERKIDYGRVHWEQLLQNMRQAQWPEAVRVVQDRNARSDGSQLLLPTAP